MFRYLSLFAVVASAVLAIPLRAEKVDMSSEELRDTATHVITGKVIAVYERTETEGDWKYTKYVAEIRVEECEKGNTIKKGDLVYARYWHRAWIAKRQQPPDTNGHRGLPSDGEYVRVYLARNAYDGFTFDNKDGGFNVIGANGFENLKPNPTK